MTDHFEGAMPLQNINGGVVVLSVPLFSLSCIPWRLDWPMFPHTLYVAHMMINIVVETSTHEKNCNSNNNVYTYAWYLPGIIYSL